MPELLLKDDSLVTVDLEAREQYLRVDYPGGPEQVWISYTYPPRPSLERDIWFDYLKEPCADAATRLMTIFRNLRAHGINHYYGSYDGTPEARRTFELVRVAGFRPPLFATFSAKVAGGPLREGCQRLAGFAAARLDARDFAAAAAAYGPLAGITNLDLRVRGPAMKGDGDIDHQFQHRSGLRDSVGCDTHFQLCSYAL